MLKMTSFRAFSTHYRQTSSAHGSVQIRISTTTS
jgi:hypothetical protein